MTQSATSSVSQSVEQLPAGGNIPADNATSINDRHVPKANETGELISNSGTGEANKPHGNAGNRHRLRHGLKASRLPKGCGHVERSITAFRQQLEAAVLDIKPEISVRDAAYVQSACRHEQRASLLFHWLRTAERSGETLGTLEREIGRAHV